MFDAPWLAADMSRVETLLLETAGSSKNHLVGEVATHLLKAGGKRARPALALISSYAGAAEGGDRRATDLAAAAVELVHVATLYHDDVLDDTETRRGVPTVHAKWGVDVAVLAGDYLFAQGCGLGARAGGEVPLILAEAIAEVCEGQIAEGESLHDTRRDPSEYLETIRQKTAALFRAACELGAVTAAASSDDRLALARYGELLGMEFQIVDDLLDLVGDPDVTGKQPGTDLREGVYTLPVLVAFERDAPLAERLSEPFPRLIEAIERTGAIEEARAEAGRYAAEALGALDGRDGRWAETLRAAPSSILSQLD